MKVWGRGVFLLCAVAGLLALPAGASAKKDPVVRPAGFSLEVGLPKSNGWYMSLSALDHRQIDLIASKGAMTIRYRVPGRASSRRVRADFGSLGRIDLRMDLEPRPLHPSIFYGKKWGSKRCSGKEAVELTGRFRGTVDFPGEPNIAGVSARTGRAVVQRTFRQVCEPPAKKPGKKGKKKGGSRDIPISLSLLGARAHGGGRTTAFETFGVSIESEMLLGMAAATVYERQGRVRIARTAWELAEDLGLSFDLRGRVGTATVEPPRPFTGKAAYLKKAGEPATWEGDLAIRLPGAGEVPLAGPDFAVSLCQLNGMKALEPGPIERCIRETQTLGGFRSDAAALLGDLYGSGSHSQPLALARLSSLR